MIRSSNNLSAGFQVEKKTIFIEPGKQPGNCGIQLILRFCYFRKSLVQFIGSTHGLHI